MASETPCLSGCRVAQSIGFNPFLHAVGCPNAKPAPCPLCGKPGCEGTHVKPEPAPPQDAEPDDAAIARAFEAQQTRGPEHVMVLKSDYRALRDRLAAAEKRVEVLEAAALKRDVEMLRIRVADAERDSSASMTLYRAAVARRERAEAENAELRETIDRLLECCGDIKLKRAILVARKEQEASNGRS